MIHCKIKLLVKIDTFCSVDVNDRSYQMDPVHLRNLLATRRIFLEEYSLADVTLIPFKEVALPPWVRAKYDWTGISIIYPSCCKRRLDRPDRHPGGGGLNLGSLSTWDGEMAIQHICREIPLFLPNGMFFLLPRMGQLRWTWPEPFQCLLKTTKEGKCEPGYLLGHLLLSYVQFYCVWGHSME